MVALHARVERQLTAHNAVGDEGRVKHGQGVMLQRDDVEGGARKYAHMIASPCARISCGGDATPRNGPGVEGGGTLWTAEDSGGG